MPRVRACPQCSATVAPEATRCEYCGTYFEAEAGGIEPPQPGPAAPPAGPPPPEAFVEELRALHRELKGYGGTGSTVAMLVGLAAAIGVLVSGLGWWHLGVLWTLVATAVTVLAGFVVVGIVATGESAREFDATYVGRLEQLEAAHGLDREATARIARKHLPETSDLRQGIERTLKARRPPAG